MTDDERKLMDENKALCIRIVALEQEKDDLFSEVEALRQRVAEIGSAAEDCVELLDNLDGGDPENAHGFAEQYLQDFANEAGFPEVSDAFDRASKRIGFWYA